MSTNKQFFLFLVVYLMVGAGCVQLSAHLDKQQTDRCQVMEHALDEECMPY